MVKPIIIAMMLLSAANLQAAERSLTSKVSEVTGCAEVLIGELSADRKAVMTQVKNLSQQLDLLSRIKGKSYFKVDLGMSFDDLDAKLAGVASDLLDTAANAQKTADLKIIVDGLRDRLHSNLNMLEVGELNSGDEKVAAPQAQAGEKQIPAQAPDRYQYSTPPGTMSKNPGREKP